MIGADGIHKILLVIISEHKMQWVKLFQFELSGPTSDMLKAARDHTYPEDQGEVKLFSLLRRELQSP